MKIVLAPDSFKESLSAIDVCRAMTRGIRSVLPDADIIQIPLADGGEGTVQTLVAATDGRIIKNTVSGPLGYPVAAEFGILGDNSTAVIEMASASGLPLVPVDQRNPLRTTTFGVGQLVKAVLDLNVKKIIIGIGGSATHDCGAGMAQALGVKFFNGALPISEQMTGGLLADVTHIDVSNLDSRIRKISMTVACDVGNPLLGEQGAARIYAPQKGAAPDSVEQLERNTTHIIDLIENVTQPVRHIPGAGAAGGLGAGFLAFLNAELASGIDTVLDACTFEARIKDADLILTGEGRIDEQSAMGKTINGVVSRASKYNIPVIALGGAILDEAERLYADGLTTMFSICTSPMSLESAIENADHLVEKTTERIIRLFKSF